MSQNLENSKVSIERNKGIVLIAAAVILSIALGGGLMKVGAGFASRASDGITVTGSAKVEATADKAVWGMSLIFKSSQKSFLKFSKNFLPFLE